MSGRNSNRAAANPRRIAGPTSALTDYLAANNISAARIARNARERQQEALTGAAAPGAATPASVQTSSLPDGLPNGLANSSSVAAMASTLKASVYNKKLSRAEAKAIDHYKTTDNFRQAKSHYKGDEDDDDTLARMFYFAAKKAIGQLENCAICNTRFTVTNYSRTAPDGTGLLCSPCGKALDAEKGEDGPKRKKQKTAGGQVGRRRQTASRVLDGTSPFGAKSLVTLCIERLSKNIELAEDLGVLPAHVVDRIARILSKRRQLNSKTLNLFLQDPSVRALKLYDAAKLSSQDYICAFQTLPELEVLKVKSGIQFKNEVMEYLVSRPIALKSLSLLGTNLITDQAWQNYFYKKGAHLRNLSVSFSDNYFTNATVKTIGRHCRDLHTLKIKNNQKVGEEAFDSIKKLGKLEHLCLRLNTEVPNPVYVSLLDAIGSQFQTLSLVHVPALNDNVLESVHRNCRVLSKLRITHTEKLTDDAFARLFTSWSNPALRFIDFTKCHITTQGRMGENKERIGLCERGFSALMAHSGHKLQHLNIESCHHIPRTTFSEVFAAGKSYPDLVFLDVSFCEVDDIVVAGIFRCCPALQKIKVFGCMKVKNVPVPRGKVLIGVSNAFGMQIDGTV